MRTIQATSRVIARRGPGRVQVALAAAWMILSLAIGGAISAEARSEGASSQTNASAARP